MAVIPPLDAETAARQFIHNLRAGKTGEAAAQVDTSLLSAKAADSLKKLSQKFQQGEAKTVQVVSFVGGEAGAATSNEVKINYEMELSTGWFAGHVETVNRNGTTKIKSAYFDGIASPSKNFMNVRFDTLRDVHAVFVGLAVLNLLFILVTAWKCLRSGLRWKLVWLILILFGLTSVEMEWATGLITFNPISFNFLGSGLELDSLYKPWIASLSPPVGALLFYLARSRRSSAGTSGRIRSTRA